MKIKSDTRFIVSFIFVQFLCCSVHGQTIKGRVLDADSKQPLSYVNIGIPGKNVGTVSNSGGEFEFPITEKNSNDTIKFSMIGYSSYTENIKDLKTRSNSLEVYLKQTIYKLKEVTILGENYKEVIGNAKKSLWISVGMGKENLGSEIGVLIKLKHSPSYLKTAHLYISTNNNKKVELRLNIYKVLNGMPGNSILHEPIYIETTLKSGIWSVDLSKYNIEVIDDFVISVEYVKNIDFQGLYFHCIRGQIPSYTKAASQSNWEIMTHRDKNLQLTLTVDVLYAN